VYKSRTFATFLLFLFIEIFFPRSVLADPTRKNEVGEILDKGGIFVVPKGLRSLALFIDEEKNSTGLSKEVLLISGVDSLKLVDYAWWGGYLFGSFQCEIFLGFCSA